MRRRPVSAGLAGATLLAEAIGPGDGVRVGVGGAGPQGQPVADYEEAAISACLRLLYTRGGGQAPMLADVAAVLNGRPDEVRAVILDRGADDVYDGWSTRCNGRCGRCWIGQFGDVFSRPVPRSADRPPVVNIDTSRIKAGDPGCWRR